VNGLPEGFEPVVPLDRCFDAQYGLEVLGREAGEETLAAWVAVRDELRDHNGALHGGVLAAAAEALASRGTAYAVMPQGRQAMGLSNDTSHVAPVRDGTVTVVATPAARGDDQWVWVVEARDEHGRLCALSRVTVAVR
jgi:1,4-dihydroxy-2-naphthoyl-CoA hydrolase